MKTKARGFPLRLFSLFALVVACLCLIVYFAPGFFTSPDKDVPVGRLDLGGTSAAHFMMDKWKNVYRKETGIKLTYESLGSTEGVTHTLDRKLAIGFTHAPLTEEQRKQAQAKGGEILHIPAAICAVVPVYHVQELEGKPPLNLTREVLADIFLGKITRWNDPALQKINAGVQLPDKAIVVVRRKDSSGTTFIFTEYLQGVSAAWDQTVGPAGSKVNWPVGEAMARSVDVSAYVASTDGAIGYVDLMHTYSGKLPFGAVQNKDQTAFIHATPENMTAAARGLLADLPEDLTFSLTNKPGKDAYPICGVIWAVCYQNQPADKRQMVANFLQWVTHEGQQFTKERTYAPLPEEIVQRVEAKLKLIKPAP
jgi:phosphate transport system substrate-binding protein